MTDKTMKYYQAYLTLSFFGLLLSSSCRKDKTPAGHGPQVEKIVMTKAADDNTEWQLNIDAATANRAEIWIDLNNNGSRDNGESVTKFGMELTDKITFPLGTSRTAAIYGRVTGLGCAGNELTKLDVMNPGLQELDCAFNRLKELNLSVNSALESLDCSYNELNTLDVSGSAGLKNLSGMYNLLKTLDLSKNAALVTLSCLKNELISLNLSQNAALEILNLYNNRLTALDLSHNKAIREVDISRNMLSNSSTLQLIASLPLRTAANKGQLYLRYTTMEGNSTPAPSDISVAKSRNWIVYEFGTAWVAF